MAVSTTDRIEKTIILAAPVEKVWQAIADAERFGVWFGVAFTGEFVQGEPKSAMITTPGWEHYRMDIVVERIEPPRLLSFRWHPGAPDPVNHANEPTTLVEFQLEPVAGGTRLTLIESGFNALPPERYADAYRGNDEGWSEQLDNIARYVDSH